jgi:small-conductance mechanosensitive channel
MKDTFIHWYADAVQTVTIFVQQLFRPVYYASKTEGIVLASIGVLLLIAALVVVRTGKQSPDHEREWTARRLQFSGSFGTVALVLAFLRYEGIPYGSMQAVLGVVLVWALIAVVQLALYRRLVLKPAQREWREHKARDQYLPKPKRAAR